MRATMRSQRGGSGKHNDRSFALDKADHIDTERTKENIYYGLNGERIEPDERPAFLQKKDPRETFEQSTLRFYEDRYGDALKKTNERYIKSRHQERVKTMEQYLKAHPPEEVILQIGDMYEHATVDDLRRAVEKYIQICNDFAAKTGGHMTILNCAIHLDEATPHAHIQRIWDYEKSDGTIAPGMNKALEQSGVDLPDPDKPPGKFNNRKMVFDEALRRGWYRICQGLGYEIETRPRERTQHVDKARYIAAQIDQKRTELVSVDQRLKHTTEQLNRLSDRERAAQTHLETVEQAIARAETSDFAGQIKAQTAQMQLERVQQQHPELFDVRGRLIEEVTHNRDVEVVIDL